MLDRDRDVQASFIPQRGMQARLYLNGADVGGIVVANFDAAWTYGAFKPDDGFAPFAGLFGRWSLLMHEDEDRPLHPEAHDEITDAERQLDQLHVKIYFPQDDRWHDVAQVSIDGGDIEWRNS